MATQENWWLGCARDIVQQEYEKDILVRLGWGKTSCKE